MINRMVRVFKNDLTLWPELKEDPEASAQGYLVILLIAGVSSFTSVIFSGSLDGIVFQFLIFTVSTLIAYVSVLLIAYVISSGRSADSTFNQLRTALAYGYSPSIFGGIPLIGIVFSVWTLITISSAIRETMGIGKGLTLFIVFLSILVNIFVAGTLIALFATIYT